MSQQNTPLRPGAAAIENMKLLKCESSVFKVPKAMPKKVAKKSKVLDEDEYVKGIAKIIQRDFFPDLEKLKAQNDFLEATENKDYARLREITKKYSGQRPATEPYNSPATFDTPIDRPYSPSAPTERYMEHRIDTEEVKNTEKDITDKHSLDSFLSTHTSEDNASYDRVISLEDRRRAVKLAPQLEAEITSKALAEAAVALPSIEQQADQSERPHELATWRFLAKNYIMYVPDGGGQEKPPKPTLLHENTRLKVQPFDHVKNQQTISEIAKTQDQSVTGKIGVDGVCVSGSKDHSGTAGYSLVATPSPRPGVGPDQSPLMTWGEIEGTPFRLDGGDTPLPAVGAGTAYRMLESGARERIALQLAEQAAKKRRPTTPRIAPPTPSFRTNTERLASMSPAARKLAAKHLLSPRLKLTPNNMGILSHSTATPKRTPSRTKTPLVATPGKKISSRPSMAGSVNTAVSLTENNLTDNLLQINVSKRDRSRAQDFF